MPVADSPRPDAGKAWSLRVDAARFPAGRPWQGPCLPCPTGPGFQPARKTGGSVSKAQRLGRRLVLTVALIAASSAAFAHPAPKKVAVADGVFLFVTPRYGDVGLDGNSIAILSP